MQLIDSLGGTQFALLVLYNSAVRRSENRAGDSHLASMAAIAIDTQLWGSHRSRYMDRMFGARRRRFGFSKVRPQLKRGVRRFHVLAPEPLEDGTCST